MQRTATKVFEKQVLDNSFTLSTVILTCQREIYLRTRLEQTGIPKAGFACVAMRMSENNMRCTLQYITLQATTVFAISAAKGDGYHPLDLVFGSKYCIL